MTVIETIYNILSSLFIILILLILFFGQNWQAFRASRQIRQSLKDLKQWRLYGIKQISKLIEPLTSETITEADIKDFNLTSIIDLAIIFFIAFFGKIIGSGGGALLSGYSPIEAVRVGAGMVPRGEVALVVASMGLRYHIFNSYQFSSVVATVLITAFIAPLILKRVFSKK